MSATVLLVFLRQSLIELNSDDDRLAKLARAAENLSKRLASEPELALALLMASLREEDLPASDFEIVSEAIAKEWVTYHGAFKDGAAITLYRGVALQALVWAIEEQAAIGVAVSLLMRNWLPHLKLGKLAEAIEILLAVAADAYLEQRDSSNASVQQARPALKSSTAQSIDKAQLLRKVEATAGPHNRASQPGENPNPQWPSNGPEWSYNFAERMAVVMTEALDGILKKALDVDARNMTAVAAAIANVSSRDVGTTSSVRLLWWRQALYSESASLPYRKIDASAAVAYAVFDLAAMLPAAYEPALESFLVEAIRAFAPDQSAVRFDAVMRATSPIAIKFKNALKFEVPDGLHMATCLGTGVGQPFVEVDQALQEWGVWFLREFSALKAIDGAEPIEEVRADE